ncbi:BatD family protein [Thalassotalea fusca]
MVRLLLILQLITLSYSAHAFIEVTATVDKNPVVVKESFVLTVTANDDIDTNALDTSPLMNDFIVGRTSVSSQTSMVNFKTSRSTRWTTLLVPKREGNITIPPLSINGALTAPIKLEVLSANDSSIASQKDIFITSEISTKEAFVQQQITLTVKLHFSAELKRGSLSEPELEDANISQIGKDEETETIINGRRYRIITRNYTISPQTSGEFVLRSPVFSGEIMLPSSRRGSFLSFAETKPVSVLGDDITLTIKPIPSSVDGLWLPSELLAIHQDWQPAPDTFKVGEPITRVITITAAGLAKEQLPELMLDMPEGLKVYPDQPELHSGINNGRLVSQMVRNYALVASKAGEYQLPEVSIPWWNTQTNRFETATLAAQTINVLPNEAFEAIQPQSQVSPAPLSVANAAPESVSIVYRDNPLQWLFLALWLLTSLAWGYSHWRRQTPSEKAIDNNTPSKTYLSLLAAAKKKNYNEILKLLPEWASDVHQTPIFTLSQALATFADDKLNEAVSQLQQAQYGRNSVEWQPDTLLEAVQRLHRTPKTAKQNNMTLNPL